MSDLLGTVTGLQGNPVSAATPIENQVLEWDGSNWSPTDKDIIPTTLPPDGYAGGDLAGSYPNPTVKSITGGLIVNVISSITSSYMTTEDDLIIPVGTLSAPITITLVSSPTVGRTFTIKDTNGSCGNPYYIIIDGNGYVIDGFGETGLLMNVIYQSITVVFTGEKWSII